jgi:hypothetical protein
MLDMMLATIRQTAPLDGSPSIPRASLYVLTLAVLRTSEAQQALKALEAEPTF